MPSQMLAPSESHSTISIPSTLKDSDCVLIRSIDRIGCFCSSRFRLFWKLEWQKRQKRHYVSLEKQDDSAMVVENKEEDDETLLKDEVDDVDLGRRRIDASWKVELGLDDQIDEGNESASTDSLDEHVAAAAAAVVAVDGDVLHCIDQQFFEDRIDEDED